jgi:hypothetical protein
VAALSLRWLATVDVGDTVADHSGNGRSANDGLGVLVVITSHATSRAAAAALSAAAPEEVVIIVCTMVSTSNSRGFTVDATGLPELQRSWSHLVMGRA